MRGDVFLLFPFSQSKHWDRTMDMNRFLKTFEFDNEILVTMLLIFCWWFAYIIQSYCANKCNYFSIQSGFSIAFFVCICIRSAVFTCGPKLFLSFGFTCTNKRSCTYISVYMNTAVIWRANFSHFEMQNGQKYLRHGDAKDRDGKREREWERYRS